MSDISESTRGGNSDRLETQDSSVRKSAYCETEDELVVDAPRRLSSETGATERFGVSAEFGFRCLDFFRRFASKSVRPVQLPVIFPVGRLVVLNVLIIQRNLCGMLVERAQLPRTEGKTATPADVAAMAAAAVAVAVTLRNKRNEADRIQHVTTKCILRNDPLTLTLASAPAVPRRGSL